MDEIIPVFLQPLFCDCPPPASGFTLTFHPMVKFLKQGKVVILTHGRFAGKKAVIVKAYEENDRESGKKYGCSLVVGIERSPLKVTKAMGARKIARRSRVKPFIKLVNQNHLMPTRYSFDGELSNKVSVSILKNPIEKKKVKKEIRSVLQEKYKSGQNRWFFQKMRF